MTKFTQKDKDRAVEMLYNGNSYRFVADALGVKSTRSIKIWAEEAGLDTKLYTAQEVRQLKERIRELESRVKATEEKKDD